jgi:hypothetical protein
MKRRSVLKTFAAMPAVAAAPAQSPSPQEDTLKLDVVAIQSVANPVPRFFSQEQFAALEKLSELLVPAVASRPGGKEAQAAAFLDFLISQSEPERQKLYREGLDRLNAEAQKHHSVVFGVLNAGQAGTLLGPLSAAWTYHGPADPFAQFLQAAKEDVLRATLNSREFAAAANTRSGSGSSYYWLPIE